MDDPRGGGAAERKRESERVPEPAGEPALPCRIELVRQGSAGADIQFKRCVA